MRQFIVTVHPMRLQVDEITKELKTYDASAIVDGDTWRYKIRKGPNISKRALHWRNRAYHHIHYHAHNSGTIVRFEHVHFQTHRKRNVSEKQLSFW